MGVCITTLFQLILIANTCSLVFFSLALLILFTPSHFWWFSDVLEKSTDGVSAHVKGGVPTLTVINIDIAKPSRISNMAVTSKVIDAILADTIVAQRW